MSDENNGLAMPPAPIRCENLTLPPPDPEELEIHLVAGERIQCTEWLVHQQYCRIGDQRAADTSPLLHTPRELLGAFILKPRQAAEVDQLFRLIFVLLFIGYFIPFSFYPDAIKPNDINENYTLFSFAYPFLPIIAIGGFLLALFVYVRRST